MPGVRLISTKCVQQNGVTSYLPRVYGSLRAYYDSVSDGAFQLHVRLINPADGDYPRWVELPRTKAHYAEIPIGSALFWDDAQMAAQDSMDEWNRTIAGYNISDLPNNSYDIAHRLRHKVLYLYSGATYTARMPEGLLHPHVDGVT